MRLELTGKRIPDGHCRQSDSENMELVPELSVMLATHASTAYSFGVHCLQEFNAMLLRQMLIIASSPLGISCTITGPSCFALVAKL